MKAGRPMVQMEPYITQSLTVSPSAPSSRASGSINTSSGTMKTSERTIVKRMSMEKMTSAR